MKNDKRTVSVRFDKDTYETMKDYAERNGITITELVVFAVMDRMREEKGRQGKCYYTGPEDRINRFYKELQDDIKTNGKVTKELW